MSKTNVWHRCKCGVSTRVPVAEAEIDRLVKQRDQLEAIICKLPENLRELLRHDEPYYVENNGCTSGPIESWKCTDYGVIHVHVNGHWWDASRGTIYPNHEAAEKARGS